MEGATRARLVHGATLVRVGHEPAYAVALPAGRVGDLRECSNTRPDHHW